MAVSPTGPIAAVLGSLKTLLCALESAQSLVGVEEGDLGSAEAIAAVAAHVWLGEFDESSLTAEQKAAARPVFVIWLGEESLSRRDASPNTWADSGSLTVAMSTLPGAGLDSGDAYVQAANDHGAIVEEIRELSATGGYLNITEIRRKGGPSRPETVDVAAGDVDNLQTLFELRWSD